MGPTDPEERAIYVALVVAGLLPTIGAVVRGGAIGAGITLCILMTATGAIGLVSGAWHRRSARIPVARTIGRSSSAQTR